MKITVKDFATIYELYGEAQETIVLISGIMGDHKSWLLLIEYLAKHFRVLVFDNRGVGQADSPDSNYSIEQMAQDTMCLVRELNIKQPHVLGHSLGGAIAQRIGYEYPEEIQSIILSNTSPKFNSHAREVCQNALSTHKKGAKPSEVFANFIHEVFSQKFLIPSEVIPAIYEECDRNPYPQSYVGYKGQLAALTQFDSRDWLSKINIPTLIVHAEEDKLVSMAEAQMLAREIPGAGLRVIPGGHASQVEEPVVLGNIINQFLIRHMMALSAT